MNTLYVLKGGMKFKFLALTVVILLGLGVGNTAWGQTTVDNGTDVALDWHSGSSWNGGSSPNLAADNLNIQIVDDMVGEVGLTFIGTNKPSQFRVLSGKTLRIKGDLIFQNGCNQLLIESNAKVIIEGDLIFQNTSNATVQPGGSLVIHGNASLAANLTLDGNFLVSGDLTYSAHALTINLGGTVVVGNNFNVSNDVALGNGGYIGVFGDLTQDGGNFNNGSGGELVVLGKLTGCAGCNGESVLEIDDPVWSIAWGINSLYWEDFVDGNTKGGYSILNGYGVVSGEQYTFNNTTAGLDAVVWESVNRSAYCNDRLKVTYDLVVTSGGSSTVKLQYSVDGGTVWQDVPAGNFPARQVKLRLIVEDLPDGAVVRLDNIHLSGTNEGGTPADLIVWGERALVVCPTEIASYTIANGHVYSSILWEVVSGGSIQGDNNKPECLVQWTSTPMKLKVTVTGGNCGVSSQQIVEEFSISQSNQLRVSVTNLKQVTCFDAKDGEISVLGQCSSNSSEDITYVWSTDNGVVIADGTTVLTGLRPGGYTVTVKGVTSDQEDTKTITITQPDELKVGLDNLTNFLCAAGTGSFTVVPTGGTAPYTVVVKKGTETLTNPVNYEFINLGIGNYTIEVTDANDCSTNETVEIQDDVENPVFVTFPTNVQMTTAQYNQIYEEVATSPSYEQVAVSPIIANATYTSNSTIETSVNLSKYRDARLSFNVTQTNATPVINDIMVIEVSFNNGGDWTILLSDNGNIDANPTVQNLANSSNLNSEVKVKITFTIVTSGLQYNISNFKVEGKAIAHVFPESIGGGPATCSDNSGLCTTHYLDSDPIWSPCTDYDDGEFRIERTWTTSDACRSVSRIQYLSVGEAPEFEDLSLPADLDVDFCENSPAIQPPTATEACGDVTISYEVRDSVDAVILNGVVTDPEANVVLADLPADPYGNKTWEYRVTWIATDKAHNKKTHNQTIRVAPQIAANYEYSITDPDLDVCLDQDVTITIKPRGGVAPYSYGDFAPDVIDPLIDPSSAPVVVTTNQLTTDDPALKFRITDSKSCGKNLQTPDFKVHQLVKTETISRD